MGEHPVVGQTQYLRKRGESLTSADLEISARRLLPVYWLNGCRPGAWSRKLEMMQPAMGEMGAAKVVRDGYQ